MPRSFEQTRTFLVDQVLRQTVFGREPDEHERSTAEFIVDQALVDLVLKQVSNDSTFRAQTRSPSSRIGSFPTVRDQMIHETINELRTRKKSPGTLSWEEWNLAERLVDEALKSLVIERVRLNPLFDE